MSARLVMRALADASADEMRTFLQTADVEVRGDPEQVTPDILRTILREAGYDKIYVVEQDLAGVEAADRAQLELNADDKRTDLQNERWVQVTIHRETGQENPIDAPVYLSCNDDFAYVPRGVPVWLRERLYWVLATAFEKRWIPQMRLPGQPVNLAPGEDRVKGRPVMEPCYPYSTHKVSSLVCDGAPIDLRENDIIIAPASSQVEALALTRQAEFRRRLAQSENFAVA